MTEPHTFYGGEPLTGSDNVGGDRHYDGQAPSIGIWKCPACRTDNEGPFEQGCVHCGAGKPGFYVGTPPPPPPLPLDAARRAPSFLVQAEAAARMTESPAFRAVADDMQRGAEVYNAALSWAAAHETADLAEAFVAGYQLAHAQLTAHTMKAAPVTADVEQLAPAGKPRRTIVAALRLFRDQVLTQTPDEIESGEWCSPEEVDALIAQLEVE